MATVAGTFAVLPAQDVPGRVTAPGYFWTMMRFAPLSGW